MNQKRRSTRPTPDISAPLVEPEHPVLKAVAAHFRRRDWNYTVMSDGSGLSFTMSNGKFAWRNTIQLLQCFSVLRIASRLPLLAPAHCHRDVALLLMRLSYCNHIGCWLLDPSDDEVYHVTNHICGEDIPSEKLLEHLLLMTTGAMADEGGLIMRFLQQVRQPPRPEAN